MTERQKEILAYVQSNTKSARPSLRELAKHFQLGKTTIQQHIRALKKKGKLQ